jgi:hypothetical protein
MEQIGTLFELEFEPLGVHQLDETTVLLRMRVAFTAHATGRHVRLPVLELLTVRRERVERSVIYLSDTAALLNALG